MPTAAVFSLHSVQGSLGKSVEGTPWPSLAVGRWWLALIVLMIVATPFSFWPGGSTAMLLDYVAKRYVLLRFASHPGQQIRFAYVNTLSLR